MADHKQDTEEYHYDDLGTFDPELNLEEKSPDMHVAKPQDSSVLGNPVIRNALIAIMVVIVLMAGYKIYTWFSTKQTMSNSPVVTIPPVKPVEKPLVTSLPKIQVVQPQPVQSAPIPQTLMPEVDRKLSGLESNQQSIQSNITVMEGQMSDVSSSVTQLNQKLETLTQTLNTLNEKIDNQSQALIVLNERTKPKLKPVVIHHPKPKPKAPLPVYYIQAIIPGRAWLFLPNGATITIRNGSRVPGYGFISQIDPRQGRILTSSGRVIRFSPADN